MLGLDFPALQNAEIILPASKSESNRALILQHISKGKFELCGLSEAQDSVTLQKLLNDFDSKTEFDCGPAGTTFRFLTALAAFTPGTRIITGSQRMQERPIKDLVDCLRQLGAEISYLKKEDYPPLKIVGKSQPSTNQAEISLANSSQYASAVLLAAAGFEKGLQLKLSNLAGSISYLNMTLTILKEAGVEITQEANSIILSNPGFVEETFAVEADWSAASYWFSLCALSKKEILLKGLKENSLQGDSVLTELYPQLGVEATFATSGLLLSPTGNMVSCFAHDFSNCPDIAQTIMATVAGLGISAEFTGLHSLRIKETDRISAMQTELAKFGWTLEEKENDRFFLHKTHEPEEKLVIDDYHDHRMLMSIAPLAIPFGKLYLRNPEVVGKSYPSFWEDLKILGASLEIA